MVSRLWICRKGVPFFSLAPCLCRKSMGGVFGCGLLLCGAVVLSVGFSVELSVESSPNGIHLLIVDGHFIGFQSASDVFCH